MQGIALPGQVQRVHPVQKLTMAVKLDEIRKAAERVAASLGLEVVDVEFTGQAKSRILCVYLEKNALGRAAKVAELAAGSLEEGAVPERYETGELNPLQLSWLTHEDCAEFSRDFGTLLDVEDLGPENEYVLEASSPGLDRRLNRSEDFARFLGSLVKIRTFEAIANNRHWQGRLTESGAEAVTIDLTATKQNSKSRKTGVSTVEIALRSIELAQLVPEF
jgi:ribosome maturation factor RimP